MTKRKRPRKNRRRAPRAAVQPVLPRIRAALEVLLHPRATDRPWKYLPLVLALAFVARAVVALSGDFVVHPDEIMQYLEPAHRLVFGSGVTYWEYFYGARSWLVPGTGGRRPSAVRRRRPWPAVLVYRRRQAVVLRDLPGDSRRHVRLCPTPLRRNHREGGVAGRRLLVRTDRLRPQADDRVRSHRSAGGAAGALRAALRGRCPDGLDGGLSRLPHGSHTVAVRTACPGAVGDRVSAYRKRIQLTLAAAGFAAAFGLFDAVVWDGGLFHSYVTNLRFNLILGLMRAGESPAYQFLLWLTLAGLGLSVLCVAAALRHLRRYGFLLGLIALVLLVHSLQAHKEYRYIFAVIPLWLLVGADLAARLAARADGLRRLAGFAMAGFAAVSLVGILNGLPYQDRVYRAWSRETGVVSFVRNQDPIFPAYRYLARAPGVSGIWQVDRAYYNLPGYYYLHRKIPFYDGVTGSSLKGNVETVSSLVSHIVSADPGFSVPGYSLEQEFGEVRILRRDRERTASPTMVGPRPRHGVQSQ